MKTTLHMAGRSYRVNISKLLGILVIAGVILGVPGVFYAQGIPGTRKPATTVVSVQSGDTLWAIAREYTRDGEDVRMIVENIRSYNSLESLVIHPGQILKIPIQ